MCGLHLLSLQLLFQFVNGLVTNFTTTKFYATLQLEKRVKSFQEKKKDSYEIEI